MGKRVGVTTQDPAISWADKLWKRLHQNFVDTEATLVEIIKSKAWEPLGYESFAKAWVDKMSDITLASELRPHVVYQMFEEGLTVDEIAGSVKGVGKETAEQLGRQKSHGVPPNQASVTKKKGSYSYATLFLRLPRKRLDSWRAVTKRHGVTLEEVALAAIEDAVDGLA